MSLVLKDFLLVLALPSGFLPAIQLSIRGIDSQFHQTMEKFPGFEPEISPSPSVIDDSTDSETLEVARGRRRTRGRKRTRSRERNRRRKRARSRESTRSSSALVTDKDAKATPYLSKNHGKSWRSIVSLPSINKHSFSRRRIHRGSHSSKKFAEFPGSLDVFPETETLLTADAFLPEEKPPPLPPRPQASQPKQSNFVSHAPPTLRHYVSSSDLNGEYTLREALGLPTSEDGDSKNQWITDPQTGRVTPSGVESLRRRAATSADIFKDRPGIEKWQNRFHARKSLQNAKRPAKTFLARLARTLTWIRSKSFKRSTGASEQEKAGKVSGADREQEEQPMVADAQDLDVQHSPQSSTSIVSQESHSERNVDHVEPAIVKRLSVTRSFSPPLAETIEDAMLKTKSPNLASMLSFRAYLDHPFPNGSVSPFTDWPTTQNVHIHEPKPHRRRPQLSLQIPPAFPHLPSAYALNAFTHPQSPPPLPRSISPFEEVPDLHLSLRGGCLPTPKTRNPAPRTRINPAKRPADDAPVPPVIWYLAGGRPVLKDRLGEDCYHGQPKPKRRMQNRRGPGKVDANQKRVPNEEPCEPLTYGHLRDWKRASRPADRRNSRTGEMELVRRSFWEEFFYSASGGKMATKRPNKEQQGADGDE